MFRAGTLNPYLLMERVVIKHGADMVKDGVRAVGMMRR
jgi:hypothetical protein